MGDSVQLQLAGETVELLGERALYRPAQRALLIADLHLGKADVFRRAGIGLPAGGTAHDLSGWMRCSINAMSRRCGFWATCCTGLRRVPPGTDAGAHGANGIARCA